jgi:hypothetical protein
VLKDLSEVTGIVKRTVTALVYYPLLDHIANELETRLVVPKERLLA